MKKKKIFAISLISALVLAAVISIIWHLYITGAFLPRWIEWKDEAINYSDDISILLEGKKIAITKGNGGSAGDATEIWHSEEGFLIQDCLLADLTGDGNKELVILCFRRMKYGPHQPFFIKKNEKNWSQHIDVYSYDEDEGSFRPIWMASDIGLDAKIFEYDETHKRLVIQDKDDVVSCWLWPGFGFVRADDSVTFAAFGDNLIHDNIYEYGLEKCDGDFSFLYKNISDYLDGFDVRVLNLETTLVDDPDLYGGYPSFGTPVQVGEAAADAGFNVFTCATNHALDKGMIGVDTVAKLCNDRGVTYLGIQSSEEKEEIPYKIFWKKGYSFAMFNYTMGLSNTNGKYPERIPANAVHLMEDENKIRGDLLQAKKEADAVIVFVHWGTEDTTTVDDFQRKWAEVFNECGVDVVVGTHPHVIQEVEVLENDKGQKTLVYYSLGNLISAQRREENLIGGIAEFTMGVTMDGMEIRDYNLEKTLTFKEKSMYSVQLMGEKE